MMQSELFYNIFKIIAEWYWLPLLIFYLGVISTILIENRNPSKTIAWILVIVFLPILGIILYYLFGQKFNKVKRIKRKSYLQALKLEGEIKQLEPEILESLSQIKANIGGLSNVYAYLKNENISLPSSQNDVKILQNGEEKFPFLLNDLKRAEHSIHLEYYIFELDNIGSEVLSILEQKAEEGVIVRCMVDAFGSPELVRFMRKKKDTKIQFQAFLPVTFSSIANSNYRNHRKIIVIDGKVGYIGGINISDRYINDDTNKLYWRDTSVRVIGESVTLLQVNFWTSWNQTEGIVFDLEEPYLKRYHDAPNTVSVSFCTSDPGSPAPYNMESIMIGINQAEQKIQLCTPYYIPSEELETALKIASSSGLDVELMIPAEGDSWIVQHASFSFLKPLLKRGVKVYVYKKGFLHAKTICIDGKLGYIGTVNLDRRSFYINYEIAAILSDQEVCRQMAAQFELDKLDCDLLTLKAWKKRKHWKRGVDSICRLLAPLL